MAVFPDLGVCRTKGTERQELPIHQTFLIFVIPLVLFEQSEALWPQQELSRSLGTEPPIADSCYIIAEGSASPVPRAGPRYPLEMRHGDLSPAHSNRTLELAHRGGVKMVSVCKFQSGSQQADTSARGQSSQPSCRVSGLQEKSFQNQ